MKKSILFLDKKTFQSCDNKSRNIKNLNINENKTSSIFSTSTKENNIDSYYEQFTSKFLNETIGIKDDNKTQENTKEYKKRKLLETSDDFKKLFKTNTIYYKKYENLFNCRIKSPKDNKNSYFEKKKEIIKKLNLENQYIRDNILKERRTKIYDHHSEFNDKLKILKANPSISFPELTSSIEKTKDNFKYSKELIFSPELQSNSYKTIEIEEDFSNNSNIEYSKDKKDLFSPRICRTHRIHQSSLIEKNDNEMIVKELYYSKLNRFKRNNSKENEDENRRYPYLLNELYYTKNCDEYVKYNIFDNVGNNEKTKKNHMNLKDSEKISQKKLEDQDKKINEKDNKTQEIGNIDKKILKIPKFLQNIRKREKNETEEVDLPDQNFILSSRTIGIIRKEFEFTSKIVDDFIYNQKPEKFRSDIFRYRKIYVILDSTVVLNINLVPGKFIDIPTQKFFAGIKTKKDRTFYFHRFLDTCKNVFGITARIKNIYLKNSHPIFELKEIPDNDKYIYVSLKDIFIGITIMNFNKTTRNMIISKDQNQNKSVGYLSPMKKNSSFDFFSNMAKENEKKMSIMKTKQKLEVFRKIRRLNNISNHNFYLLNKRSSHSFDYGRFNRSELYKNEEIDYKRIYISVKHPKNNYHEIKLNENFDKEDLYFSENEDKKIKAWNFITSNFNDGFKLILYYYDFLSSKNWIIIKNKIKYQIENKPKNKFKQREINKNIVGLVDKFNDDIRKKIFSLNNFMEQKKTIEKKKKKLEKEKELKLQGVPEQAKKFKKHMQNRTIFMMKKFLEKMNLFKSKKETDHNDYFINQEVNHNKHLPHVYKNIEKHKNVYYFMDKYVNSVLPTLFNFNIPKLMEKYKNFTREELYELYTQYKVLMKICIASNKNPLVVKKGIDFRSFHKGVLQMSNESEELAKNIFKTINETETNYLSLDEFLKGMSIIKSENITDKIDMFFKIIDTDGNGRLSWDEVFEISIMSLKRSIMNDDEKSKKLIDNLARYFADLIFKMVDVEIDDEIPLNKIKEKIIEGGEEGTYLEMFCCADNFKKKEDEF